MPDLTTKGHSCVIGYADEVEDLSAVDAETAGFTTLALLVDVTGAPSPEADDIDISHMLTEDQEREYAPGWSEPGEMSFVLQFTPEQHATLRSLYRVRKTWRIVHEDDSGDVFNGYLKSVGQSIEREGIITQEVSVKISGKVEAFPGDGSSE